MAPSCWANISAAVPVSTLSTVKNGGVLVSERSSSAQAAAARSNTRRSMGTRSTDAEAPPNSDWILGG